MKPDWWIVSEVARRMGYGKAFSYQGPAEIFAEHAALTEFENSGSRKLNIGAYADIDTQTYDDLTPFQWPQRRDVPDDASRLYGDGKFSTPNGKAQFVAINSCSRPDEAKDEDFTLNTGRIRDQWHTMTRTGKSNRLAAHMAEPFVEINPADARRLGITDADVVEIANAQGSILVRALLTNRVQVGALFVPMHWTGDFASAARVDVLVEPIVDPVSGQPALKSSRAHVRLFDAKLYGFAICRDKPDAIDADYWARAVCESGWRVEFASAQSFENTASLARSIVGVSESAPMLAYHDKDQGQDRFAFFDDDVLIGAVFLSARPVAVSRSWAVGQLSAGYTNSGERYRVVAGRAGGDQPDRGAIVCACFSVGVNQIAAAVLSGTCRDIDAVGRLLKAGTNCGSCRTEIKGIVDAYSVVAAE